MIPYNSTKRTFSFDSEMDRDILEWIDSCPTRKKSRLARKAFRAYLDSLRQEARPIPAQGMKITKKEGNV